jgi:hypothetical protein
MRKGVKHNEGGVRIAPLAQLTAKRSRTIGSLSRFPDFIFYINSKCTRMKLLYKL